jgi:hypothetical protein
VEIARTTMDTEDGILEGKNEKKKKKKKKKKKINIMELYYL